MGVDDGLFAGSALEEFQVLIIIHEEVLCEDCGAEGVAEDVEVFFPVGVVVGVVCSDASVWEVLFCSFVEAFGDTVRGCLAFAGVAGPSGCVEPFCAVSCSIAVDADEDDVGWLKKVFDVIFLVNDRLQYPLFSFIWS